MPNRATTTLRLRLDGTGSGARTGPPRGPALAELQLECQRPCQRARGGGRSDRASGAMLQSPQRQDGHWCPAAGTTSEAACAGALCRSHGHGGQNFEPEGALAYSSHGEDLGGASDADLIRTVTVLASIYVCSSSAAPSPSSNSSSALENPMGPLLGYVWDLWPGRAQVAPAQGLLGCARPLQPAPIVFGTSTTTTSSSLSPPGPAPMASPFNFKLKPPASGPGVLGPGPGPWHMPVTVTAARGSASVTAPGQRPRHCSASASRCGT